MLKKIKDFLKNSKNKDGKNKNILAVFFISVLSFFAISFVLAVPPSTKYAPGGTLNPACSPGSTNCTVDMEVSKFVDGIKTNDAIYTSGNVGIGTSSPVYPLVVSNNGAQGFEFIVGGTNFIQSYNRSISDYTPLKIDAETIAFATDNGAERMRIDRAGNVGIGVSSSISGTLTLPNDGLISFHDASGNARNSLQFASGELKHGAAGAGLTSQTFYTNGNERIRINILGNIGIGTTSPSKKLDVVGDINFTGDLYDSGILVSLSEISNLNLVGNSILGKWSGAGSTGGTEGTGSGLANHYLGYQSGNSNTTGNYNTANGYSSLYANTTGYRNTANGYSSLYANTTGKENTANGYQSLRSNTTGSYNTANGTQSLRSNTTGSYNTANGLSSLYSNTTGYRNTANGYQSLHSNTTGSYNIANGFISGRYTTSGAANQTSNNSVYLGYDTRSSASGNTNEVVIGSSARGNGSNSATLGNDSITKTVLKGNVGIGTTTPASKLVIQGNGSSPGSAALNLKHAGNGMSIGLNTSGTKLMVGNSWNPESSTYMTIVDGTGSVGIGTSSPSKKLDVVGDINFTGDLYDSGVLFSLSEISNFNLVGNSILGKWSGLGSTGATEGTSANRANHYIGYQSGNSNTSGSNNTANGTTSLYRNTTGSYNTANGSSSLRLNTTGNRNTANGYASLYANTTGYQNTANGTESLFSNTTGNRNTANGLASLYSNTTGSYNTANGHQSGIYTTSGAANQTSSNSVYLGYDTRSSASGNTNEVVIGSSARGNGSNSATLGNDSITKTVLKGNVGIGTSSPTNYTNFTTLAVGDSAQGGVLELQYAGVQAGRIVAQAANTIAVTTNNSEAMRIDSVGNVLIGKTASSLFTVGAELTSTGQVFGTVSGAAVARFNRKSTEGEIVDFRKDDVTVGSIGTSTNGNFMVSGNAGDSGIELANIGWLPTVDGARSDNDTDLGYIYSRFKDLHLAGTAYVGGNVGIGTATPTSKLVVGGNGITTLKPTVQISDSNNGASLSLRGRSPVLAFDTTGSDTNPKILMDSKGVEFKSGTLDSEGNVHLKIDSSGNVGIGTTSPSSKLDVNGTIVSRGGTGIDYTGINTSGNGSNNRAISAQDYSQWIWNTANNWGVFWAGNDNPAHKAFGGANPNELVFVGSGLTRAAIDLDNGNAYFQGNVGIGTTAPTVKLDVVGDVKTSGWYGRSAHNKGGFVGSYNNVGSNATKTNPIYTIGSSYKPADSTLVNMYGIGFANSSASFITGGSGWGMYVASDGDARSFISGSGSSYFNAGNVGIGTTAPAEKLDVAGNILIENGGQIIFSNNGGTSKDFGIRAAGEHFSIVETEESNKEYFRIEDDLSIYLKPAGSTAMTLNNTGNVGIGTTAPSQKLDVAGNINFTGNLYKSGSLLKLGDNPVHSSSDFTSGTLITTNIPATATNGNSFVIEISGKSYSNTNAPFKVIAQGYLYNGTIINYSGMSYGGNFSPNIKMFGDGGVLKFWWPRISYWNSFNVHVRVAEGSYENRVTTITNSTEPTGTKKVTTVLQKSVSENTSGNVGIGTTAPSQKLHVAGNILATGTVTGTTPTAATHLTTKAYVDGRVASGGDNLGNHAATSNLTFNNYGRGLVGLYSASRYQNLFSMGAAYTPADNGTSLNNMYGIAWTHSNVGGESIPSLGHQALFVSAGDTRSAIGDGIWTKYNITGNRFLDQNNPAYYVDPASTSNMNTVNMNAVIGTDFRARSGDKYDKYCMWGGSTYCIGMVTGQNYGALADYAMTFTMNNNSNRGFLWRDSADSASDGAMSLTTTGVLTVKDSVTGTHFVDGNNTGYYVDPASTSNLNSVNIAGNVGIGTTAPSQKLHVVGNSLLAGDIMRSAHNNGYFVGSYNNVRSNGTKTNPIYTIGSSYKPADSTLGDMYGIGYTNSSASFITGGSGWGMYIAADGDARNFISAQGSSYFNAGNVGIGTSSPSRKLDVVGDINFTGNLYDSGVLFTGGGGANFNLVGTSILGKWSGAGSTGTSEGTGSYLANHYLGYNSGTSNTTGRNNTANGMGSLYLNTTGSNNTANGSNSLFSNREGNYNTANGEQSLYKNTSGSYNTANGSDSLYSNKTGSYNTANGYSSLYRNTTGSYNTANGYSSLYSNKTGSYNTANGYLSLFSNTSGSNNTANGHQSGRFTTPGAYNQTSSNSVYLGYDTRSSASGNTNEVVIGSTARGNGSNTVRLGNTSIAGIYGQVGFSATSDRRLKKDIKNLDSGLDLISKLTPVSYVRKNNTTKTTEFGLIAQDLKTALKKSGYENSGIVQGEESKTEFLSVRYTDLIAPLIKAVQEQQEQIEEQQGQIGDLKNQNDALTDRIEKLEK